MNDVNSSVFREYDIRGIIGETLNYHDAYLIGRAFASSAINNTNKNVVIGRDGRLSSPMLVDQLVKGLTDSGANVTNVGCGPTPMIYFANYYLNMDGAIMVTGSHNPPNHNGFKMIAKDKSFYGKQINNLKQTIKKNEFESQKGSYKKQSVFNEYIREMIKNAGDLRPYNIVWDCGNGSSGELILALVKKIPGNHHVLFSEIDGNFPNHHPDPVIKSNLETLIMEVKNKKADFGIAFDGDGDRLGVVTNEGKQIPGDLLTAFLSGEIIDNNKNPSIIFDIKSSYLALESVKKRQGNPVLWKTGHSLIKAKLQETGGLLAGEMSGHIFFADRWFGFDDAPYASLRLINELSRSRVTLKQFLESIPSSFSSPEIRIECDDRKKFKVIKNILDNIKLSTFLSLNEIDGIRVNYDYGWWLLRPSNTQACIVARAEGKTKKSLEKLLKIMSGYLKNEGINYTINLNY